MVERRLRALADNLWACELRFRKSFMSTRIRMTVIRLPSGGVLLYSPVPIDDALAHELAVLGQVEHIVAPSCLHDLHCAAAKTRYPAAKLWAAPGLIGRRRDVQFDAQISEPPPEWGDSREAATLRGGTRGEYGRDPSSARSRTLVQSSALRAGAGLQGFSGSVERGA